MGFRASRRRKLARSGLEKAIEEIIHLAGIDREQGEAGVKCSRLDHRYSVPARISAKDRPSGDIPDCPTMPGRLVVSSHLERLDQSRSP